MTQASVAVAITSWEKRGKSLCEAFCTLNYARGVKGRFYFALEGSIVLAFHYILAKLWQNLMNTFRPEVIVSLIQQVIKMQPFPVYIYLRWIIESNRKRQFVRPLVIFFVCMQLIMFRSNHQFVNIFNKKKSVKQSIVKIYT